MRRVAAFLALPSGDRILLLEAFATLAAVRLALHLTAADRLRSWAARVKPGTRSVDRISWAVRVASRQLSGTTCLGSALTLQRLLSTQGHVSELHIGVAKQDQVFAAHAWIVCEGRILMGDDEHDGYTRLVTWKSAESSGLPAPAKSDPG
jgi:hypothetical protein